MTRSLPLKVTFHKAPSGPKEKGADTALIFLTGTTLPEEAAALDREWDGLISHHVKNHETFKGKKGQTLLLSAPRRAAYARLLLAGLGDAPLDADGHETLGGRLYPLLKAAGAQVVDLYASGDSGDGGRGKTKARSARAKDVPALAPGAAAAHLCMGLLLRAYSFDKYKTRKDDAKTPPLRQLRVTGGDPAAAKKNFDLLEKQARGVYLARDLINEPPNELYPDSFARIIRAQLAPLGVKVEIIDEKRMEKLGFHAHLAVGMGSSRPPRVVVMRWTGPSGGRGAAKTGKGRKGPIALVGKGVTFDTGGMNLKPSGGMEDMKLDMGGAAAVVGAIKTLALRGADTDVVGIVGLAENMPSHTAFRPSDVIKSLSGQTIEVMNTDAEGRLILADALTYVQRTYKPRAIVDLATLTGAMMIALGHEYCGTFANDDDLWRRLDEAGRASGEKLWRMPLDEAYSKQMDSTIADIKSLGSISRYGGACTAAGFLHRFIETDCAWAHMDIAGVAWVGADRPTASKPAVGFGVRTLDRLVESYGKA